MLKLTVSGALFLALVISACDQKDPYAPGTPMGTYNVSGALVTNTCGDPGSAPNPWTFTVRLSRDGTTLYWLQGDLPVSGVLNAQNTATLTASAVQNANAADSGLPSCAIERDDTLGATLGAATSAGVVDAFTGTLSYAFNATSDSMDCSSQLESSGGGFAALPCTVSYTLTAARDPNASSN